MAIVDAIEKLHTSMIDTCHAYERAEGEAEEPALKILFADMVALRRRDHDDLHRVLIEMGETPDEDGSFMTNVHRAVIAVRSAVTGVGRGSLSSFASGEENVLKEYDDALAQEDIQRAAPVCSSPACMARSRVSPACARHRRADNAAPCIRFG